MKDIKTKDSLHQIISAYITSSGHSIPWSVNDILTNLKV